MRKIILFSSLIFFSIWNVQTLCSGVIGDINHDGKIDLKEAIYAIQVTAGMRSEVVAECDAGYYDLNQIQEDGCEFYLDPDAIYVSEQTGVDDAGCGFGPLATGGGRYPCMTIKYGLEVRARDGFQPDKRRVIVANGRYTQTISLVEGIDLLGGYRADTWERNASSSLTIIQGDSSGAYTRSVSAQNISEATEFSGFVVEGQANFTGGGTTYALYITNCTAALKIIDNRIIGGIASSGLDGAHGTSGAGGGDGQDGTDAIDLDGFTCSGGPVSANAEWGNFGADGDGGSASCADGGDGGDGGGGMCPQFQCPNTHTFGGYDGANGSGGAAGGAGGVFAYNRKKSGTAACTHPSSGIQCTSAGYGWAMGSPGSNGENGIHGTAGVGCPVESTDGVVHGLNWIGIDGGDAPADATGGAGGGGAATAGMDLDRLCSGGSDTVGASGGGAGGCPGNVGGGGRAGGGAFSIFIAYTNPTPPPYPVISSNRITPGHGGKGGNGGMGGFGGSPGRGGIGGSHVASKWADMLGPAGPGGSGGDGGHSGGGGGGCGGVSYGIYAHNFSTAPVAYQANAFSAGGDGGSGCSGGTSPPPVNDGSNGAVGSSGELELVSGRCGHYTSNDIYHRERNIGVAS